MWYKINEDLPPLDRFVLCKWENGHLEGAEFDVFEGKLCHWLDNGEVLPTEPIEWMEIPK